MNRIVLLSIALLTAISVTAQVQSNLVSAISPGGSILKSIVRETSSSPCSIIYLETTSDHYFAYYDGYSSSMIAMNIGSSLCVNDFVVSDDSVFFCGANSGQGCVGHFDIQDFFYGTQSYAYTLNPFFINESGIYYIVESFDKMVAYFQSGMRWLAATAQLSGGLQGVGEIRYTLPLIGYHIGLIYNSNEKNLDIALTENYVVTAGFKNISGMGSLPCVRVYNRGSLFMSGGPQDTVTHFPQFASQTVMFNSSQLVLSHLQNDDIALAAYWRSTVTNNDAGTFVGMQSIASNHDVSCINSMVATQYHQNGGWQLRGLTTMDNSSYFYLLQTAETANTTSSVDLLFSLTPSMFNLAPNGTNINVKQSELMLMSIDARAGYTGFVSDGYSSFNPFGWVHFLSTTNTPGCLHDMGLSVYPIYMTSVESLNAFHVYTGLMSAIKIEHGTRLGMDPHSTCAE